MSQADNFPCTLCPHMMLDHTEVEGDPNDFNNFLGEWCDIEYAPGEYCDCPGFLPDSWVINIAVSYGYEFDWRLREQEPKDS